MADNQPDDEVADQEVVRRMTLLTTAEASSPTIKAGVLTKRSGGQIGIKNWRKRWFVLTSDLLAYLDTEGGLIKGGILLEGATEARDASTAESGKHTSCFVVATADRNFIIRAASDDDRAEWIKVITNAISALKAKTGSTPAVAKNAAGKPDAKILVYYWPVLGRAGALFRMLNEAKVPYEHRGGTDDAVCASFGGNTGIFAPPAVVDGDFSLSQSTACALYIGTKCGFVPDSLNPFLAAKYMADIVDFFELNLGKNNENGKDFYKFMEGGRFEKMVASMERNIVGPYYFGKEKSYVDFFLAQNWDWAHACALTALQEKTGKDYFAAFPKIKAAVAGIQALASYKDLTGTPVEGMLTNRAENFRDFSVKPEVLEAYGPDSD